MHVRDERKNESTLDNTDTTRYVGVVKFVQHSHGLISCPDVLLMHDAGNVYVDCSQFPQLGDGKIGQCVSFAVSMNKGGRPQALDVESRFHGHIKFYDATNGYGFITCSDMSRLCFNSNCDVYLNRHQLCYEPIAGDLVSFAVVLTEWTGTGSRLNFQAMDVHLASEERRIDPMLNNRDAFTETCGGHCDQ